MAFRQPTAYHAPQRIYTAPAEEQTAARPSSHIADSQEWILFSPSAASTTDRGYTASTARTRTQTVGRSRISDFGSLDTAARSYDYYDASQEEEAVEEEEEDGELDSLDSLDSHLQEFKDQSSVYAQDKGEQTVLPTHDGLGSFRLDQTVMGEEVQEHLYAFERFNPRRVKRRRESLELGMLELESERAAEAERTRRIEKWRVEQSRLLVDEIQKETRRRKQSMSTDRRSSFVDREQEDVATMSNVDSENTVEQQVVDDENESFWNRITKRVIRDLIGIDDDLLEIIFGESLPEDDDLSTTPPGTSPLVANRGIVPENKFKEDCWEHRLLERISRELGILVNQLSDHPGAFSTYLQSATQPLPYAGLPVIPETAREPIPTEPQPTSSILTSPADPEFQPTIQPSAAIPITTTSLAPSPLEDIDSTPRPTNPLSQPLTREEWERDLDIKMVFRYLRSRFTAKFSPSSQPSPSFDFQTTGTSHLATASTADAAARAARVRQHHPLVTRQTTTRERRRSIEKRTWKPSVPGGGSVVSTGAILQRRGSSSCARTVRSGSSRHYWDFGPAGSQSVGSGSLIASSGGMGSWGEV
ncbi:uncharacterized protein PAC_18474 [Phialocephala subalpina]|uniref:Uncharacterized protein n=1 Tax=Phialocephala subalpina TaxID=576137 RepID=A0A1L7XU80_9HELO|nr:uncharacterized protein PAC_18474 [Phialocephala subalpina]